MIEVKIKSEQIERAKQRLVGRVLNNSITKGKSELYGKIAECIIEDTYGGKYINDYEYDLIVQGKKIEVKAKKRTVKPQPHYYVSIADFNTTQKCDLYCFVSVMDDLSMAYICGWMTPKQFYSRATFYKKGEPDPHDNTFLIREDSYNLEIKHLKL